MATVKSETPVVETPAPSALDDTIKSLDALVKSHPKTAGAIGGSVVTGIAFWIFS